MSCNWDVFCFDCNEKLGLYDWNHMSDEVQKLIANASTIAALAPLDGDFGLTLRGRDIGIAFFVKHNGYKLSGKQQGREPTPEERARGEVIGFRDLTDEEKLADAVETMKRQIEIVSDAVDELPAEGP